MIGIMLEHDFMIKKRICDTFVLTKRGFSGSGQMLLNTLSILQQLSRICESAFVATPDLLSAQDVLARYRCTLNGIDLTTTDIVKNTPLHWDRLMYTMANANLPLVNLNNGSLIIANPVPFADDNQMFNIKLSALSGQTLDACVIYLFKQVNRVLRI